MDLACTEKDDTEILSDSDHSTKVAPTTLTSQILRDGVFEVLSPDAQFVRSEAR